MPSYGIVTYGAFIFDGVSGAAIDGDIVVGAVPRSVTTMANALSREPVQVNDFTSDFGVIQLPVKLSGRDTLHETAPDHLQRMWDNLQTEVDKDANTLTIAVYGTSSSRVYRIFKNDDFEKTITALTQARSVMKLDLVLKYLP
jgi:hypothetical protein